MASRAVFLPTISHAISNSVRQRTHSASFKEKLREINRQEQTHLRVPQPSHTALEGPQIETQPFQRSVSTRLWRLMQRRLRDPSAGRSLKPLQASNSTLPVSDLGEDFDNMLSMVHDRESEVVVNPDMSENLMHADYDSEWEDLFADEAPDDGWLDEDMLDDFYTETTVDHSQDSAYCFEDMVHLEAFEEQMLDIEDSGMLHI